MSTEREIRCFVCDKQLEPVYESVVQPHDGLTFSSGGNYGSTIFDPSRGTNRLVIVICDGCVTERLARVWVQTTKPQRANVTYTQVANVQELPE